MTIRTFRAAGSALVAVALAVWAWSATAISGFTAQDASQAFHSTPGKGGFEVWIADQSDTRPGFGGQLLIYDGSRLMGKHAANARPIARLDLGAATADLCRAATGRNPVRPHMILFNNEHTHAVLSFVASGHVVIFDAERRTPLNCFETTVGSTGTRQAHAAYPAPDGSFILVANQNGKRLERIDTNFRTNTFVHNPAATLDLLTCTTPSGQPCEHPDLRPINWPICPFVDSSSRHGFVTLRGGGLFVIDAKATPMAILAEYDKSTVKGNGCGALEVGRHVYINSGGSPVNVSANRSAPPVALRVRRLPVSAAWLLRRECAQHAHAGPAPVEERDVGFPRRRGDRREPLPLGHGSARRRRRDHRRPFRQVGEHRRPGRDRSATIPRPT